MDDIKTGSDCSSCGTSPSELLAAARVADSAIGRRTFLVQSGILAAIAALNACGNLGGNGITAPSLPSNASINVNNYSSLSSVGGVAMVTLGSAPIAIVRTGTSSFIALSRVCTHQGGIVELYQNDFVCPVHGATYNLSGQWIGGQPATNLHQYTTSYDAATGTLTISRPPGEHKNDWLDAAAGAAAGAAARRSAPFGAGPRGYQHCHAAGIHHRQATRRAN